MDAWMAPIGFGTLLVTVAGFGVALVMLVRSMRKSNDAAHAKTGQHIRDLRGEVQTLDAKNEAAHVGIAERIDTSRAEVLGQVRHLDAKNEAAHAGIVERIDATRAEVLGQVRHLDAKTGQHIRDLRGEVQALDAKNEVAHAGIVERIDSSRGEALARADRHAVKLDAIAHDVAFLAGRQQERDAGAAADEGGTP